MLFPKWRQKFIYKTQLDFFLRHFFLPSNTDFWQQTSNPASFQKTWNSREPTRFASKEIQLGHHRWLSEVGSNYLHCYKVEEQQGWRLFLLALTWTLLAVCPGICWDSQGNPSTHLGRQLFLAQTFGFRSFAQLQCCTKVDETWFATRVTGLLMLLLLSTHTKNC